MTHYVGIDASLETVNSCIVDQDGIVVLESRIEAEPSAIAETLKRFDRPVARVGLEAGPTASWLYSELRAAGLPAVCMECRHVKAGLGAMRNKTDRNDARGIAQLVRLGWFLHVFVKSDEAQRIRMLLVGRAHLMSKSHDLENCIRGSLRVFGLRIGTVTRNGFEVRVLELMRSTGSIGCVGTSPGATRSAVG
jgi:transposase